MVRVKDLLASTPTATLQTSGNLSAVISNVQDDSRKLSGHDPTTLFIARRSRTASPASARSGVLFAARKAVEAGVPAVVTNEPDLGLTGCAVIHVPSVDAVVGRVSALVYGEPANALSPIGVTGTDGKTTTSYMTAAAIAAATGQTVGLSTTVQIVAGGLASAASLTTPEAPELQRHLAKMRDAGDTFAVIETSSLGIEQGRVGGIHFAASVFTNLTREHLDLHNNLEAYFEAKAALFAPASCDLQIVNVDTAYGARLADRHAATALTVSTNRRDTFSYVEDLHVEADGSTVVVAQIGTSVCRFQLTMPGIHNVANALAALATAKGLGLDLSAAAEALKSVEVPGRMESVPNARGVRAFVDFAHTPAGLEATLQACRNLCAAGGRVIVVIGCGGDRDRSKRPAMAEIAGLLSDVFIATSDNPRSEEPMSILQDMTAGRTFASELHIKVDRRAAIRLAAELTKPGDVLVVAGRGHERTQETKGQRTRFIDQDELAKALQFMGAANKSAIA